MHTTRSAICRQELRSAMAASLLLIFTDARADAAGLSLEQAVAHALAGNQELRAARSDVEAARVGQAGLMPNPRLEVGVESDRAFGREGEYAYELGLSQDIPVAGRLEREKDVARVELALAEARRWEAERQLLGRVAGAFYGLVVQERQEKELHASYLDLLDQYLQARAALDAATVSFPLGESSEEPRGKPAEGGR